MSSWLRATFQTRTSAILPKKGDEKSSPPLDPLYMPMTSGAVVADGGAPAAMA